MNTPQDKQSKENECSDTSISFQELEDLPWQPSSLGEYRQLSLWKSTLMPNSSSNTNSQVSPSTQTLETTNPNQENSTSSQWDFPVREHQTQEAERDSNIQLRLFGEKDLDALSKLNPASVLSNNLKELSDEDFELFLADSAWQDTLGRLKQSRQQSLERVIKDSDYLSFPTLTSNESSTSRPAGQSKCEKWFKDKGLIPNGSQLGTKAIASLMNFPTDWFSPLSPTKHQEELELDTSQDAQLLQHKQRSLLEESSTSTQLLGGENLLEHKENKHSLADSEILLGGEDKLLEQKRGERSSLNQNLSIPCIVKQPKQAEVKGVIRKDEGDCEASRRHRFLVDVDGDEISVSKLFVYPDLSKTVGQIPSTKKEQRPRADVRRKGTRCDVTPPSKVPPTKTRRKKGDGTGYIYRRTITRKGKQYQESYFRYRDESGKLKAKYIPQRLLSKVEEAQSNKKPIADILFYWGEME